MKRAAQLIIALTLIAPALARAADAPAAACDIAVSSRPGGLLDVILAGQTPGPGAASQIIWRPPGSGPSVELWVVYPAGPLAKLSEPSGLVINFKTKQNLSPDSTMLTVKTRNGRSWAFNGKMVEFGKDGEARVKFDQDWAYGRGLLGAVADSQPLSMSVVQDSQVVASETFALGNIDARDRLLAEARAQAEGSAPRTCLK